MRAIFSLFAVVLIGSIALADKPAGRTVLVRSVNKLVCPTVDQVESALERRNFVLTSKKPKGILDLENSAPTTLHFSFELHGRRALERTLTVDVSECGHLAQTVALFVDTTWDRIERAEAVAVTPPIAPPVVATTPPPVSTPSTAESKPEAAPAKTTSEAKVKEASKEESVLAKEEPKAENSAQPAEVTVVDAIAAVATTPSPAKLEQPKKKVEPIFHLELVVMPLGTAFAPERSPIPVGYQAGFQIEMAVKERWGFGIRQQFFGPLQIDRFYAHATLIRIPSTFYARVAMLKKPRFRLSLAAGVTIEIIRTLSVTSDLTQIVTNPSQDVIAPAVWAGLSFDWFFTRIFFLQVGAGAHGYPTTLGYSIEFNDIFWSTPRIWAEGWVGVGARLF